MSDRTILLLIVAGVSALFMALAVPLLLGKVKPNGIYGVRTSATLGDERIWYEVNRRFGRVFVIQSAIVILLATSLYVVPQLSFDNYAFIVLMFWLLSLFGVVGWSVELGMALKSRSSKRAPRPWRQ